MLLEVCKKEHEFALKSIADMLNKICKISPPWVFVKTVALQICSNFTGEHPCGSVISINLLATLLNSLFCSSDICCSLAHFFWEQENFITRLPQPPFLYYFKTL